MLIFLYATFGFLLFVGILSYKLYRFTQIDTTTHDMNFVWVDFPITRKDIKKT